MSDITNELVRLSELMEKGLITKDEFDAAKAKLIGESAGTAKVGGPPPIPPGAPPAVTSVHASHSRPSALRPPPSDDIPPGIKGWSWGAFLWNWIWAIFNNTWIGLLALIPGVNLVMIFVLGAKGREWAWKNKKWDSVEHFNRVQRKWSLWGIWLVIIGFVLAFLVFLGSLLMMGMAGSKMSGTDFMQALPSTETTDTAAVPEDVGMPMTEETATETFAEDAAPAVAEDAVTDSAQFETDATQDMTTTDTSAEDAAAEQAAAEQARQQADLAKIKAEADAAKAEAAKAKKEALKAEKALAEQRRRQEEERRAAEEQAAREEQMRCPYSSNEPLVCSSQGSQPAYCDWNFSACGNPRLSKKVSKKTCNGKVSWDPDNNQLIVVDGCRAQFVPVQ